MNSIPISDCQTHYLFLLVGGNTLPNYVAAQLLTRQNTTLYLVYSEGTKTQLDDLLRVFNDPDTLLSCNKIDSFKVHQSNPTNIFTEITKRLPDNLEEISVGLHYTGGTKVMSVHAYRAIQDWQKKKPNLCKACYTYLDARTLHLWAEHSDWVGAQALFVGNQTTVLLQTLLTLHHRNDLQKDCRTEAIWPYVVEKMFIINGKEQLRKSWVSPWNTYKQFEEKNEQKLSILLSPVKTDKLHPEIYFQDNIYKYLQMITGSELPISFGELITKSPFSQMKSPFYEAVKWFTGGWFEDYVFLQLKSLPGKYKLSGFAMNVKPKIGNKDFEFDVVAIRHYQLYAFACTLDRGRATCKSKLLEAVARARQLGGSEARIALVCCIDDPLDLENEVEALVRDNQVKVFGQSDLPKLQSKIEEWLKELDLICSKP